MRVLVVDDSATTLVLMSQIIASINATALTFDDPVKALSEAPHFDIDLAVVDYEMPGTIDGVELIKRLRAIARFRDLPVVMVTACERPAIRYAALDAGATDFLRKPIDPIEVKSRLRNLLKLSDAQNKLRNKISWLAQEVSQATRALLEREEEIIYRLSLAAEYRDTETGAHIARMARYCLLIAEALGLDAETCRTLYLAAPMHDIGKIAVADSILLKPGRLTAEERAVMEHHTLHGYKILSGSKSPLIRVAAEIAVSHHERWDGTGYPGRLSGASIPLFGRIAAIADVFDALTSERPYKAAWSPEKARASIIEASGTHFDPDCVAAFLGCWDEVLSIVGTNDRAICKQWMESDQAAVHSPLDQPDATVVHLS
jgi:putative two-component system response regulator